jgi:hypothetical protein
MERIEVKCLIWAQKEKLYIIGQWGLKLIFRMHNIDPTPQGVENRNILLWFKCVLTALHVNCIFSLITAICYFIYAKFAVMLGFQ